MKLALLLSFAVSATGCYPLPSPTYSVSQYGLEATLVDAASGEPLRRKDVTVTIGSSRFDLRTSSNGKVSVSALRNHYWTWLGGPAQASVTAAAIVIESDGFEPRRMDWSMFDNAHLLTKDGRIQAGRVAMKNR